MNKCNRRPRLIYSSCVELKVLGVLSDGYHTLPGAVTWYLLYRGNSSWYSVTLLHSGTQLEHRLRCEGNTRFLMSRELPHYGPQRQESGRLSSGLKSMKGGDPQGLRYPWGGRRMYVLTVCSWYSEWITVPGLAPMKAAGPGNGEWPLLVTWLLRPITM